MIEGPLIYSFFFFLSPSAWQCLIRWGLKTWSCSEYPGASSQPCLTLSDPMDCSPPGSSVHQIFQARTLEWAAISSSRDLPNPGIEPCPLHLLYWQTDSLPLGAIWEEPPLYLPKWGQGSWSFFSIWKSHLADFNLICPLEGADLP